MADRFDSGGVESLQHVERQGGKEEEGGWSGGEGRRQFPVVYYKSSQFLPVIYYKSSQFLVHHLKNCSAIRVTTPTCHCR